MKLTIAQAAQGFGFGPVYVARGLKFFEDEGIEVDHQVLQGGSLTTTAVVNGEAQFMAAGSSDMHSAYERQLGIIAVAAVSAAVPLQVVARKDFMSEKGLTPQSPLSDKVQALKGARIGVHSAAGLPARIAQYLLTINGLNPESDAHFVTIPQGGPNLVALRQNQIDVHVSGIPDPQVAEHDGIGTILLRLAEEVPVFQQFIFNVFAGKREWIEQNAEVTERAARAIGRAHNVLLDDVPRATTALNDLLPLEVAPAAFETAMQAMRAAYVRDGKMTAEHWKNASEAFLRSGVVKTAPSSDEGEIWTNKYLVNVPPK